MNEPISIVKKSEFPEVIETLENLMTMARTGEIESIAIVARTTDGNILSKRTKTRDKHHLVAGVAYLLHDLTGPEE